MGKGISHVVLRAVVLLERAVGTPLNEIPDLTDMLYDVAAWWDSYGW